MVDVARLREGFAAVAARPSHSTDAPVKIVTQADRAEEQR
jgi:hypothetical protein